MAVEPITLERYDPDKFIVDAFVQGLGGRFDQGDIARIRDSLASADAKGKFAKCLVDGAYAGAQATIKEAVKSVADLLTAVMNWTLEAYTTVYDPQILLQLIRTWTTGPDTPTRTKALLDMADLYRERHPAGSAALRTLSEVLPLLDALADWLRQPQAIRQILMAIARTLGDVLGDAWNGIRSLTGKPEAQGFAVGDILGRVTMELALFLLGF